LGWCDPKACASTEQTWPPYVEVSPWRWATSPSPLCDMRCKQIQQVLGTEWRKENPNIMYVLHCAKSLLDLQEQVCSAIGKNSFIWKETEFYTKAIIQSGNRSWTFKQRGVSFRSLFRHECVTAFFCIALLPFYWLYNRLNEIQAVKKDWLKEGKKNEKKKQV
jgi:hypothetical protein